MQGELKGESERSPAPWCARPRRAQGTRPLQGLAHVDAVPVRIRKDKAPRPKICIANGFDDLDPVRLQMLVQGLCIVHQKVGHVLDRRLVAFVQGKMQLGIILLEDGEADRTPVIEDLGEPKNAG